MGTSGLWGFRLNGVDRITYNHFDSYPSGLGADLLAWAREADFVKVREQVAHLRLVDQMGTPTPEERAEFAAFHQDVSTGEDWYSLLRSLQGDPALTLEAGVMTDGTGWDGEWAYLFDLDTDTFEVHAGSFKTMREVWPLHDLPSVETFDERFGGL
jgi:hypothetical protein